MVYTDLNIVLNNNLTAVVGVSCHDSKVTNDQTNFYLVLPIKEQ